MPKTINLVLSPKQAADESVWLPIALRMAAIRREDLALARVVKRSVDARSRTPKINLTVEIFADKEPEPDEIHFDYPDVNGCTPVIIVGGGPAGLFAALHLIESGRYRPIILERGKEVSPRRRDIARIHHGEGVDPDSNYAFGEGGAGTFSDGKLFTRSKKRGDFNRALQTLVFHGASPEILYEAHPHIGTDRLPRIIENIRKTILSSGGEIHFNTKVTDFIISDGCCRGVCVGDERIEGAAVVLATGHSADDIYRTLHRSGVVLEPKPFAMGVRIEHPQELIDTIQYHSLDFREWLPAASYQLVSQIGGRGVYSFCMCPGGVIVPAATASDECVVNGMSASARSSRWANSGIVTEIRTSDFAELVPEYGALAGLEFRSRLEHRAAAVGGGVAVAPAQRLTDFLVRRPSHDLPRSSFLPSLRPSEGDEWLPRLIAEPLRSGLRDFGRKMRGFVTPEAQIIGLESRTSTPVRIPRDELSLCHPQIAGLYPAGEGAGYAGGIISAAMDGERVAERIVESKL